MAIPVQYHTVVMSYQTARIPSLRSLLLIVDTAQPLDVPSQELEPKGLSSQLD